MADETEETQEGAEERQEGAEEASWDDVVTTLASPPAASGGGDNAWRNDVKGQLVQAGLSERAAHLQAFNESRVSSEALLRRLTGGVSSEEASPASGPTGRQQAGDGASKGQGQSRDGREAQAGSEDEDPRIAELRSEIAALKHETVSRTAAQNRQVLDSVKEELIDGGYPELRNRDVIEGLKPAIKAALNSGLTDDYGQALRIATWSKLGQRAGSSGEDVSIADTTDPILLPAGTERPGSGAVDHATMRQNVAAMLARGASEADVMRYAKNQRIRR